jgi:hypothetical protein
MKELEALRTKVKALDSLGFLRDNVPEKEVREACIAYLKSVGYKVTKKPVLHKVKKLDELVDLFYNLMEFYHNEVCSLVSNRQKDRVLISNFLKNRQVELSCSFDESLQDCANIIYGLFIFEETLDLSYPVSISIFSENCKWITDRVIAILNENKYIENEIKVERMVEANGVDAEKHSGFDLEKLRRLYDEEDGRGEK